MMCEWCSWDQEAGTTSTPNPIVVLCERCGAAFSTHREVSPDSTFYLDGSEADIQIGGMTKPPAARRYAISIVPESSRRTMPCPEEIREQLLGLSPRPTLPSGPRISALPRHMTTAGSRVSVSVGPGYSITAGTNVSVTAGPIISLGPLPRGGLSAAPFLLNAPRISIGLSAALERESKGRATSTSKEKADGEAISEAPYTPTVMISSPAPEPEPFVLVTPKSARGETFDDEVVTQRIVRRSRRRWGGMGAAVAAVVAIAAAAVPIYASSTSRAAAGLASTVGSPAPQTRTRASSSHLVRAAEPQSTLATASIATLTKGALKAAASADAKPDHAPTADVATTPGADPDEMCKIAASALGRGDITTARKIYQRAVDTQPQYLPASLGLADATWASHARAAAIALYQRIEMQFSPRLVPARVHERASLALR